MKLMYYKPEQYSMLLQQQQWNMYTLQIYNAFKIGLLCFGEISGAFFSPNKKPVIVVIKNSTMTSIMAMCSFVRKQKSER